MKSMSRHEIGDWWYWIFNDDEIQPETQFTAGHLVASPVERLEEDQSPANCNAILPCSDLSNTCETQTRWKFKNKQTQWLKPTPQSVSNQLQQKLTSSPASSLNQTTGIIDNLNILNQLEISRPGRVPIRPSSAEFPSIAHLRRVQECNGPNLETHFNRVAWASFSHPVVNSTSFGGISIDVARWKRMNIPSLQTN